VVATGKGKPRFGAGYLRQVDDVNEQNSYLIGYDVGPVGPTWRHRPQPGV
jgi:hypothetical protein